MLIFRLSIIFVHLLLHLPLITISMGASSPDFLPFCDLWTDGSVVKFSISLRRPWNGFVIVLAIAGGVKVEGLDHPEWVLPLSGITLQFYRTVH